MIGSDSRYYLGDRGIYTTSDGRQIAYLKRRMLPPADASAAVTSATVAPGARLDLITAKTLGSPLQFWRVADANQAMNPPDLTEVPGRTLRIPAPGR